MGQQITIKIFIWIKVDKIVKEYGIYLDSISVSVF